MLKKVLAIFLFCFLYTYGQDNSSVQKNQLMSLSSIPISVTIGGDFITTGSFVALNGQRLDSFVSQYFTQAKTEMLGMTNDIEFSTLILKELDKYALRDITVIRKNGEKLNVDLMKFRYTGDFKNNPYLINDDVVIFPSYDIEKDFIEISGAVNKPVKFQFVEGDKLSDAILFASGISDAYSSIEKAEISRLDDTGQNEEIILVDIDSTFTLQRGDRIDIKGKESFKKAYKVLVIGEVYNPGFIFVTKNNTTVSEVIEKAGGFNTSAWLNKVQVIRGKSAQLLFNNERMLKSGAEEYKRLVELEGNMLGRMGNLDEVDTMYFRIENEIRMFDGGNLIDFTDKENKEARNLIVENGEVILVPKFEKVVNILGQVPVNGKFEYVNGKGIDYYVGLAGGYGDFAEEDEVMLIKGKNKNWLEADDPNSVIEPGDYIWVPKEPIRNFGFYVERVGVIAGIIGALASTILLLSQINK